MIHTIGIKTNTYHNSTIEELVAYFSDKKYIQVDTETSGMDCFNDSILCIQLGDFDNQFIVHPGYLQELKSLLETRELLLQNAKFDLKFLYVNNIWPTKVYDTFLAEAVLYCGIKQHKKSLAAIAKNRLDIDLDKTIRDNIWKEGLTDRVIEYSANDVKYLELIKDAQAVELTEKDLWLTLDIENRFVLALAYIEYCGFKLDTVKWLAKADKSKKAQEEAEVALEQFVVENDLQKYIDTQGDLFSTTVNTRINWDAPKQVIPLFKDLGIEVTVVEKGEEKESIEADVIEKQKNKNPIIPLYLNYKAHAKEVSTYGYNFLNYINKATNRVHTSFKQIMDTGRLSSGSKNRATGEQYPNFQNIPSDPETRSCFIAEEGNILLISDYSGQEQIVLANKALDPALLEFYDNGLADMHSFVASKMYTELEGMDLDDIKKHHKEKRQAAKSAGFAINYGGVGKTIADNLGISLEEGNFIYESYFEAFPGLAQYFEQTKKQGLISGFIYFNDVDKRKSYIENFDYFLKLQEKLNRRFWDEWELEKQKKEIQEYPSARYLEMKEMISKYFNIKGMIERRALNYPVQGSSASITKVATTTFFEWIRFKKLFNKVMIVNSIHDEIVAECAIQDKDKVANALEVAMNNAGDKYCKRVPLKAEPEASLFWKK